MKRILNILSALSIITILFGVLYYHFDSKIDKEKEEANNSKALDELIQVDAGEIDTNDPEKAGLSDVTGNDYYGSARRSFRESEFTVSIEAALPILNKEDYYQAWAYDDGDENTRPKSINLGYLEEREGNYYIDFYTISDLRNYKRIVITKKQYGKSEKKILEGSFE